MRFIFILMLGSFWLLIPTLSLADRPNLIWINAEDMSQHLGCYGHPDAHTPRIDQLAQQGILYHNAFATAPICSPARSCLATGWYATSLGTQHLRCEVEIPRQIVPLAKRLQQLGYFCTNTGKSDYNFDPDGIWDAWNNDPAPWNQRQSGQPFFSFITIGETHEGRINFQDRYEQATVNLSPDLKHDPSGVTIPPFYPDTPKIREIFARLHDLATVFDQKVGSLIDRLKADGDLDDTIVFVFGDHGNGLPRYKRWLCDSGLRVPLVVYVPPKFQHLIPEIDRTGSLAVNSSNGRWISNRLVSFVDFPATAVALAGGKPEPPMQGIPFLGTSLSKPREFVFGARSRADDMFEVSRSVSDGDYIYIRHFYPHLPYIQASVIFDDRKDSYRELRRLHQNGKLDVHASKLWMDRKPVEELYDLKADPNELVNLAGSPAVQEIQSQLRDELRRWILRHRDSGFLPEAEYQIRARQMGITPFELLQHPSQVDLDAIVSMAWRVGDPTADPLQFLAGLRHHESAVRYWSAVGLQVLAASESPDQASIAQRVIQGLDSATSDRSPSVAIAAAEALNAWDGEPSSSQSVALKTLGRYAMDARPWVSLQAARAIALQGDRAQPIVPLIKQVVAQNRSAPGSKRPYKDFNYASFTGWALETALLACGEAEYVAEINQGQ